MVIKFAATLLSFLLFICLANSQSDSLSLKNISNTDSVQENYVRDSISLKKYFQLVDYKSSLLTPKELVKNDIQQFHTSQKKELVFVLLILLLVALTYVKTVFGKELEEMIQSVISQNLSQQIFRTQSGEISFASFLLHVNFIVTVSLYVRFFLMNYFHVSSLENFSTLFFLIFLFTFFYVSKIIALQFVGRIFEVQSSCNEYIFNFTILCKTIGLTLLPALFIFYSASEIIFNFIFIITIFFFILFLIIFVWRALSTASKLLYRSVYHFFIYVCVMEISMIFLFFKLLTKTII